MKHIKTLLPWTMFALVLLISNDAFAQSQQYLHFDNDDDIVEIPKASQYIANSNAITMAGWFYCEALSYGQGYLSIRNGGSGDGEMYMIQINDGVLENRLIINGTTYEVVTPAFTAVPEVWQHIAWVYDGVKVALYVDGEPKGSAPASGAITSSDTPLSIGKHISPWGLATFDGGIDEVSLWSKALSQVEIQDMMANELVGDEAGLELYYKMNQGVPEADNTAISKLVSEIGSPAKDGDLKNFALIGPTSNFVGTVDVGYQAITFPILANKLVSDLPFLLEANASSGLDVSYEIISGPASVNGNEVTLDGVVGEVVVKASQAGDGTYDPAEDISASFQVLDPETFVPDIDIRSPLSGDVMVPNLGPIQLAAISHIDYPELFSISDLSFEINGEIISAKDWNNDHYTAWWTPPTYGNYTLLVKSENNYGASNIQSVDISIIDNSEDMSANAAQNVWLSVNVSTATVEAELPSYAGAFDQILGNLNITCPTGGCDPWDRISGVEVKGHNGEWYEIIRYITPYGVPCMSDIDLTDFMSTLQGKVAFRFNLGTAGNGFEYTLDLDYKAGTPDHPYSTITKLWYDTYDFGNPASLQPTEAINIQYPADAKVSKIKLVSTGHGWGDNNSGNAAEFHEDTHHVWVNGAETFEQHNWQNCDPNPDGCNPQNGTWFYDRAGWCPGTIAPWFDYEMTPFMDQANVSLEYIFNESYIDLCHTNNPNCVSGVTCPDCNDGFNPHLIVSSYLITLGDAPVGDVSTSAKDMDPNINFSLFPNPTQGLLTLELEASEVLVQINVFNSVGQKVYQLSPNLTNGSTTLNLSSLHAGVYYVEIQTNNGVGTKRIVLEE